MTSCLKFVYLNLCTQYYMISTNYIAYIIREIIWIAIFIAYLFILCHVTQDAKFSKNIQFVIWENRFQTVVKTCCVQSDVTSFAKCIFSSTAYKRKVKVDIIQIPLKPKQAGH